MKSVALKCNVNQNCHPGGTRTIRVLILEYKHLDQCQCGSIVFETRFDLLARPI